MPASHSSLLTLISICLCILLGVGESSRTRDTRCDAHLHERADTSSFAITGIPPKGTGPLPNRLEIRQLQQNTTQWNLYLLALNQFVNTDQSTKTSYYQIAGIHGRPFVEWDNVAFAPGRTGGYCTHSSPLFLTWHRPYVALYEQVLYGIVQDIAKSFTGSQQAESIAAAESFRVPYWDWAAPAPAGQDTLPTSIMSSAMVEVTTPNGTKTIPNPLYQYKFNPLSSTDLPDSPFSTWQDTLRYPTNNNADATSQNNQISSQLDKNQASYSKRYLNLLQAYPTFEKFSNKAWLSDVTNPGGSYDSLESLHDAIHGLVGNGGHMTYNEYSAFDPIFMLHHANIDRLFAIWQTIHPDTYLAPSIATTGTATLLPNSTIDPNTPLTPFHNSTTGTFWTSASVRTTTIFGYTYPETAENNATYSIQYVNRLYSPSAGTPANKTTTSKSKRDGEQPPGVYTEWITNIRVAQNALDSTFTIYIFLGEFSSDPNAWLTEKSLVGSHTVFMPFSSDTQQNADIVVAGTVPLTKELNLNAKGVGYNTANVTAVEEYLTGNLHWRVARLTDNTEVPRETLPSLKVSVVSCPVTEAKSDVNFPNWGECTPHTTITDDKAAGLQSGEPM